MLYGLVLYETFEYLRSYPNDGLLRRGIVFSCLTTSLLAMIAQFANVYLVRQRPSSSQLWLIIRIAYSHLLG